jgi:hypothetical protein
MRGLERFRVGPAKAEARHGVLRRQRDLTRAQSQLKSRPSAEFEPVLVDEHDAAETTYVRLSQPCCDFNQVPRKPAMVKLEIGFDVDGETYVRYSPGWPMEFHEPVRTRIVNPVGGHFVVPGHDDAKGGVRGRREQSQNRVA